MDRTAFLQIAAGSTGRWFLSKFSRILNQLAFFWVCLKVMVRHRSEGRHVGARVLVQQVYFTGVQSLELVTFFALLFGVIMVVQGFTLLSSIGAQESLATFLIAILLRELGPLLTAIIVVLRSGSAIALEIGYMNVLGEIEGLEMQGIPTLHFLFVPRLLGVTISVVCLVIVFDLIAIAGGFFAAWILTDVNVWNLLHDLAASISRNDFIIVLAKALCFGVIIPVVCMYNGFLAKTAITSIPPRVSRALVDCLLYCVFFSVIITAAYSV